VKFLLIDGIELVPAQNVVSYTLYTDKSKEIERFGVKLKDGVVYTYTLYTQPLKEEEKEEVLKVLGKLLSRNKNVVTTEEILSTLREAITELRNPKPQRRGRKKKEV